MNKILFLSLLFSSSVIANVHYATGKIADIVVGDDIAGKAVIYIENFSEANTCPKFTAKNLVIASLPESKYSDSLFSAALMAYASNKEVKIRVDETKRDANGWCEITQLRVNKNF
ncbi:hypothetical protein N473_02960 [Pseudoalteromonas luteoviolacea CPMOR-1]|uniref:Uncharacterized protein n=1 Tax=Pseudoalteromonas luteoviolacea CPMOR-1 TaxID=1365248 RepID=A0A162AWQ0_9GAMM|nr:hypothetical protein [Pseudoalteromonas luteoviolacea]KZN59894.1 hypothetical protein N473_02960 [Pseudoalteromonas luteoviolacea CPMOR-1]